MAPINNLCLYFRSTVAALYLQPSPIAFVSKLFAIHHDLCPMAADFLTQAVAHIVSAIFCNTSRFRRQQLWEVGPLVSRSIAEDAHECSPLP